MPNLLDPSHDVPNGVAAPPTTTSFAQWERLGRGWLVAPHTVNLEPVFRLPFREEARRTRPLDDARKPTVLERLLRFASQRAIQSNAPEDDDLGSFAFDTVGPLDTEFVVSLAPDMDVPASSIDAWLVGLPGEIPRIAFEVAASSTEISVRLACRSEDASSFYEHTQAAFPDAVVLRSDRNLEFAPVPADALVIDFGLSNAFWQPLRLFRSLDPDPLTAIFASLNGLRVEERAVFQVVIEPVVAPWASALSHLAAAVPRTQRSSDPAGLAAHAERKLARPLFAVLVRLGVHTAARARSLSIARALTGALGVVADPAGNELIPLANDGYDDTLHERTFRRRTSCRTGMLLSAEELVALVHPPGSGVHVPKLIRHVRKTRAAPHAALGYPFVLGRNVHAGRVSEVSLSSEQRSRHVHLIGASGTGKSTLLLNLIVQDLAAGSGFALLDPHGDLVDAVLERIPPHRRKDVIVFDPADTERPVGFNPLAVSSDLERTLVSSDLVSGFRRLSETWGDQMDAVFANAIDAFLENDRGGTLLDVRRFLVDTEFRNEVLKTVHDPAVVRFWTKEFGLLSGRPQGSILTRLDVFLRPKPVRGIVSQRHPAFDLRSVMDEGKILLAKLSQGLIGEKNAYLLGTLLVGKLQQLALARQSVVATERRPFTLYLDEFHNFVTPTLAQVLSGARKYRLGLVLAHQDLQQLASRDTDVLASVLANSGTRICFRVGDADAKLLEKGFASFTREDLQRLGTGQAIVRIGQADHDCNLDTVELPRVDPVRANECRESVLARSREHYGRPPEIEVQIPEPASVEVAQPEAVPRMVTPPPDRAESSASTDARQSAPTLSRGSVPTPPASGHGSAPHRYLQTLIQRWGEQHGWGVMLEEVILEGLGRVDVVLRKGECTVACEIGVSTSAEHELGNLQKCLTAGFSHVLGILPEKRVRNRLPKLVTQLGQEDQSRVRVLSPDELLDALTQIDAETVPHESEVRGYKVKVRTKGSVKDGKTASNAAAQVIARALGRLRQ